MIYATILICAATVTTCDLDHAKIAEQSAPVYLTDEDCVQNALRHIQTHITAGQERDYKFDVTCELAVPGAPA